MAAPYDSLTTVLNAARGRLNDAISTLDPVGGKILDNTQPFSQQMVNNGWRKLQEFLADLKYSGLEQEANFLNVAGVTTTDPLVQVFIDYDGYFDGTVKQNTPKLPQNFIRPYKLWERISGSQSQMYEMDDVINGLPSVQKITWNRQWEWRDDVLYMPGATSNTDIRMRFGQYLADFLDNAPAANTPWYAQTVPIMRALDAFADYICREFEIARQNPDAAVAFQASAESNARRILNRDTTQPKSILKTSEFGKMQDRYTPNSGADTQPVKR